MIKIEEYSAKYKKKYVEIVRMLWNDVSQSDLDIMVQEHEESKGYIVVATDNNQVIGFLNSAIRQDYVEGSDASQTGYVEGVFVKEEYRQQGIAQQMLHNLIQYYKTKNITSIGSDAFVDNHLSDLFHKAVGFKEVSINRHYIYTIK